MILSTVFQTIYGVISFFHLQGTVIVALLWIILHFTGVTDKFAVVKLLLSLALILSVLYAVYAIIKSLLGLDYKRKKRRGAEVIRSKETTFEDRQDKPQTVCDAPYQFQTEEEQPQTQSVVSEDQPKYFRVRQNPSLIMAEYNDRYELYKITDKGLLKMRTDFKQ